MTKFNYQVMSFLHDETFFVDQNIPKSSKIYEVSKTASRLSGLGGKIDNFPACQAIEKRQSQLCARH
jgi:hypothetical protein